MRNALFTPLLLLCLMGEAASQEPTSPAQAVTSMDGLHQQLSKEMRQWLTVHHLNSMFQEELAVDYFGDRGLEWPTVQTAPDSEAVSSAIKSFSPVIFPSASLAELQPLAQRLLNPNDAGRLLAGDKTLTSEEKRRFNETVMLPLLKGVFAFCGIGDESAELPKQSGKRLNLMFEITRVDHGFADTRTLDLTPSFAIDSKTIKLNTGYKIRLDLVDLVRADSHTPPTVDALLSRLYATIFHEAIHIYMIESFIKVVGAKFNFDQNHSLNTPAEGFAAHRQAQRVAAIFLARQGNKGLYFLDEAFVHLTVLRALNIAGLPFKMARNGQAKPSKSDDYFTFEGLTQQIAQNFGIFLIERGYAIYDETEAGKAFLQKVTALALEEPQLSAEADAYDFLESRKEIFDRYTELTLAEFGLTELITPQKR